MTKNTSQKLVKILISLFLIYMAFQIGQFHESQKTTEKMANSDRTSIESKYQLTGELVECKGLKVQSYDNFKKVIIDEELEIYIKCKN